MDLAEQECPNCNKKFCSQTALKKHFKTHDLTCDECSIDFRTFYRKKLHDRSHHAQINKKKSGRKDRICRICPELVPFKTEEEYLLHVRDVHQGKLIDCYMCNVCGKTFKTRSELRQHINSKCGTVKLFVCKVCGQKLMSAGSLYNHMRRHSDVANFICRFCAKLFNTAGQLKVHERIHTQQKDFICDVCGKGFCHRQSLITHSTLHTGIKPYQCEACGKCFSCVGNLLKHRKSYPDTCALLPLTGHRVDNPLTKIKLRINTPVTSKLKEVKRNKELQEKLAKLDSLKVSTEPQAGVSETEPLKTEMIKVVPENFENQDKPVKTENRDVIDEDNTFIPIKEEKFQIADDANEGEPDTCVEYDEKEDNNDSSDDFSMKIEEHVIVEEHNLICIKEEHPQTTDDVNETEPKICIENDEEQDNSGSSDDFIMKESSSQPKIKKKGKRKNDRLFNKKLKDFIKERKLEFGKAANCKYCSKEYTIFRCLYKHELEHEGNGEDLPFKCSCCKKSFEAKDDLKHHQQFAHSDVLTCRDCGDKIFANMDSLRSHRSIIHKGARRKEYIYICDKCGKRFKQKRVLQLHKETSCGRGPFFQCKVCEKNFSSEHSRKQHMRIHTSEKSLTCKFCGKAFHWKGQLKIHERSHTGEKPYTCLFCPRAFAYRDSLITHSTLHTGIKPYFCKSCGKRFSCVGNLAKHKTAYANTCGAWYEKNEKDEPV